MIQVPGGGNFISRLMMYQLADASLLPSWCLMPPGNRAPFCKDQGLMRSGRLHHQPTASEDLHLFCHH
ncbi:hypothetical protein B5X24_HaOG213675 [Helicoverpa armigera]|uniref:Uncharacterized protein n=1 Tax=Helicoverpa armigera TaxID=29058 RepID=A0A2W1B8W0_HELAM|nr:hypothetical protein B5X24_HaOG213675 [Helicoverpa armigera]